MNLLKYMSIRHKNIDWGYWRITKNGELKWEEHQLKENLRLRISYISPSDTTCF